MNKTIFLISEYIINSKKTNINLNDIINKNYSSLIIHESDKLSSFELNIRVFQKLVLHNYCFNYYIDGLSDNELKNINNYLLYPTISTFKYNIRDNMKHFLDWCKKFNLRNKNKISIISGEIKNKVTLFR